MGSGRSPSITESKWISGFFAANIRTGSTMFQLSQKTITASAAAVVRTWGKTIQRNLENRRRIKQRAVQQLGRQVLNRLTEQENREGQKRQRQNERQRRV